MGWVHDALSEPSAGRSVKIRPQLVTLAPVAAEEVRVDNIVLVKVRGDHVLHLVKEIRHGQLLIGNNLGKLNGWTPITNLPGRVVAVSD